jgi:hypothetical protein
VRVVSTRRRSSRDRRSHRADGSTLASASRASARRTGASRGAKRKPSDPDPRDRPTRSVRCASRRPTAAAAVPADVENDRTRKTGVRAQQRAPHLDEAPPRARADRHGRLARDAGSSRTNEPRASDSGTSAGRSAPSSCGRRSARSHSRDRRSRSAEAHPAGREDHAARFDVPRGSRDGEIRLRSGVTASTRNGCESSTPASPAARRRASSTVRARSVVREELPGLLALELHPELAEERNRRVDREAGQHAPDRRRGRAGERGLVHRVVGHVAAPPPATRIFAPRCFAESTADDARSPTAPPGSPP